MAKTVTGQDADAMEAQDKLVGLGAAQSDPYKAVGTDFPYTKTAPANGQGSDAKGENNVLLKQSSNQEGPRQAEGDPSREKADNTRTPAVSNFKVERNKGESNVVPGDLAMRASVNLFDGDISATGYKQTRTKEVEDPDVSIG